jgi:hypothetical protein
MAWSGMFSLLSPILKIGAALAGRKSQFSHKRLEAHLIMRGIVAEMPEYLPFRIIDGQGKGHRGVYVIGMLLWNKGSDAITRSDFLPRAPLQISLAAGVEIIETRVISAEDDTEWATKRTDIDRVTVDFDCLNPHEYLVISLFVADEPTADVRVTGKIIGQDCPIDHTAREVRASPTERVSTFFILLFVFNSLPGFFLGAAVILKRFGWKALITHVDTVPLYLWAPFVTGTMAILMFIFSRVMYWNERRQYPEGYPLYADLEPPLLENIRGMVKTVFQAKKQRLSTSLFDWGKPILLPNRKVRRRTVDDWIE